MNFFSIRTFSMLIFQKRNFNFLVSDSKVFDLKNTPAIVWGTPQMPFYFVRLKDLNAKE